MENPSTAAAILDIDLDALASNIRLLQSRAPRSRMAGIVKANAYGIGVEAVAEIHKTIGTRTFFVATPDEGIALRAILGPGYEIAILGGLFHGAVDDYVAYGLTPVINALDDLERVRSGQEIILHFDTGMNRLGLDARDTQKIIDDQSVLKNYNTVMVMSHFSCADEPGNPVTRAQFEKFAQVAQYFPQARKSLSNSSGIFAAPDYHFDVIRPGMAVYGLNPTPDKPNPMAPVVGLKTRVLQVREIAAGEPVGYGGSYQSAARRRIATVALGYADGFLRSLGNKGRLFWQGHACPIVGRISMDLVTIDVTDVAGIGPVAGDWIDVLGAGQDADALANAAGTIGYEILTGLGARYARRYVSGKSFDNKAVSG